VSEQVATPAVTLVKLHVRAVDAPFFLKVKV
jgi:hypothetical protein